MIEGYRDFFTYRKKFERKKMMDEKMMFIMMIFLAATFMLLIYTIFKNIKQWRKNNASPVLSVPATVVSKHMDVHDYPQENGPSYTSTNYFVTFELENGRRLEFKVKSKESRVLAERDQGTLTYQGTRYLGFRRDRRR